MNKSDSVLSTRLDETNDISLGAFARIVLKVTGWLLALVAGLVGVILGVTTMVSQGIQGNYFFVTVGLVITIAIFLLALSFER